MSNFNTLNRNACLDTLLYACVWTQNGKALQEVLNWMKHHGWTYSLKTCLFMMDAHLSAHQYEKVFECYDLWMNHGSDPSLVPSELQHEILRIMRHVRRNTRGPISKRARTIALAIEH